VIYKTSERIAKLGFFTRRPEIPRLELIKNKEGRSVHVLQNQILSVYPLLLDQ